MNPLSPPRATGAAKVEADKAATAAMKAMEKRIMKGKVKLIEL